MLSSDKLRELADECAEDPTTWDNFVNEWIEKHPDGVFEIISSYLEDRVNLPEDTVESDEWNEYLEELILNKYEEEMEHRADAAREEDILRSIR